MLRDLCTLVGAYVLIVGILFLLIILVGATLGNLRRQRIHVCSRCETIDANSAFLGYRCTVCGRRRELGVALHIASNRRRRRSA